MSQLDVLFVHPNASKKIYQGLSKDFSAIEPPIWAALLANHVRSKGHSVKILDCEAERLSPSASASTIASYDAKLIAFVIYGQQPSASTQNMSGARDILNILKEGHPDTKTILIGLHPSAISRNTLESENTDFVCQGEGLKTITGLLGVDMDNVDELCESVI